MNRLRELYGDDFDPVIKMSENADFMHQLSETARKAVESEEPTIDSPLVEAAAKASKDSIDAWDKVAKYTTPQLKSIEVNLDANVGIHEGLPEVDDLVEEVLGSETDSHPAEDLSD